MNNNNLGNFVISKRMALGMSQTKLAIKGQFDASWLSRIETGKIKNPTAESLEKLARALEVPPDSLVSLALKEEKVSPLDLLPFVKALANTSNALSHEDLEFLIGIQKGLLEAMTVPLIEELLKARKPKTETPT